MQSFRKIVAQLCCFQRIFFFFRFVACLITGKICYFLFLNLVSCESQHRHCLFTFSRAFVLLIKRNIYLEKFTQVGFSFELTKQQIIRSHYYQVGLQGTGLFFRIKEPRCFEQKKDSHQDILSLSIAFLQSYSL